MFVSILFTIFVRDISHSMKSSASKRYTNVHSSSSKVPQILMKLEYSRQFFKKFSNIKFHKYPFRGSRVVIHRQVETQTDGRTDRRY